MSSPQRISPAIAAEIDRLATAVAKDPRSKEFLPLADEYIKAGMWQEAAAVLEDGLLVPQRLIGTVSEPPPSAASSPLQSDLQP